MTWIFHLLSAIDRSLARLLLGLGMGALCALGGLVLAKAETQGEPWITIGRWAIRVALAAFLVWAFFRFRRWAKDRADKGPLDGP